MIYKLIQSSLRGINYTCKFVYHFGFFLHFVCCVVWGILCWLNMSKLFPKMPKIQGCFDLKKPHVFYAGGKCAEDVGTMVGTKHLIAALFVRQHQISKTLKILNFRITLAILDRFSRFKQQNNERKNLLEWKWSYLGYIPHPKVNFLHKKKFG